MSPINEDIPVRRSGTSHLPDIPIQIRIRAADGRHLRIGIAYVALVDDGGAALPLPPEVIEAVLNGAFLAPESNILKKVAYDRLRAKARETVTAIELFSETVTRGWYI